MNSNTLEGEEPVRQKVEIEHPDWRGGGFQCLTCKTEVALPTARPEDALLLCPKCHLFREMAEVTYVAPGQTQEKP